MWQLVLADLAPADRPALLQLLLRDEQATEGATRPKIPHADSASLANVIRFCPKLLSARAADRAEYTLGLLQLAQSTAPTAALVECVLTAPDGGHAFARTALSAWHREDAAALAHAGATAFATLARALRYEATERDRDAYLWR